MSLQLDTRVFVKIISDHTYFKELSNLNVQIKLLRKASGKAVEINTDLLFNEINKVYTNQVFTMGQKIAHRYLGHTIVSLTVEVIASLGMPTDGILPFGQLTNTTEISFTQDRTDPKVKIILSGSKISASSSRGVSSARQLVGIDFEKLGIGGLDNEFSQIFRRAFASRIYPPDIVKKLGTKHVRGLMLYGPPGCGKTLVARQLSKVLQGEDEGDQDRFPEPKIVSGPEILNKYVGGSEEKVRELFKDAEADEAKYGEESGLHVIILDEIDAICRRRGSSRESSGVGDSVVNQLLAKIDGVNSLNNILLIGLTNRLDIIDPALLRPGRFEIHIEISLPTRKGRLQILRIHTSKMREAKILNSDVDFDMLAEETKNYSGAEIEGLVKSAASFAYLRHVNEAKVNKNLELSVKKQDFSFALKEIKPVFGVDKEDELGIFVKNGIYNFNEKVSEIQQTVLELTRQVEESEKTPLLSLLLHGCRGCGKTALAASIALESGFPFVKFISPDIFIGMNDSAKCSQLASILADAYKSPLSLIVLDDIERIIDFVNVGPRFSNTVLQTLLVLINKVPPKANSKLFILGTTSTVDQFEFLSLLQVFSVKLQLPTVDNAEEVTFLLSKLLILNEEISSSELDLIAVDVPKPMPIKKLLVLVEMAKQQDSFKETKKVTYRTFMKCVDNIGYR